MTCRPSSPSASALRSLSPPSAAEDDGDGGDGGGDDLPPLTAAIVGAGPSGLLLAHRLLSSTSYVASVDVFESRPDPRSSAGSSNLAGRAYALGVGGRARRAIRSVDDGLWESVKGMGYECDKFQLWVRPNLRIRLRDGPARLPERYRDGDGSDPEPSVLIYQTDLCSSLLDELEIRHGSGGRLGLYFDTKVRPGDVDLVTNRLAVGGKEDGGAGLTRGPYDLMAGCGGVNSPVRRAIESSAPGGTFECETRTLDGVFKVARLPAMPPGLDPDSVALLLPGGGKKKKRGGDKKRGRRRRSSSPVTAFVEPVRDGGACVLFAGRGGGGTGEDDDDDDEGSVDPLLSARYPPGDGDPPDALVEDIVEDVLDRFPLLVGTPTPDLQSAVRQLLTQRPGVASSVRCNVYHYRSAVLCGDSAHATGGVSGQGANSAFLDSMVLADCLDSALGGGEAGAVRGDRRSVGGAVRSALLRYSQLQVPEGLALYDLSFGPGGDLPLLVRLRTLLGTVRDALFGGRMGVGAPLLQVQLSSTTRSFADIRRDREGYFGEAFPDLGTFEERIAGIYGEEEGGGGGEGADSPQ